MVEVVFQRAVEVVKVRDQDMEEVALVNTVHSSSLEGARLSTDSPGGFEIQVEFHVQRMTADVLEDWNKPAAVDIEV